ncbi:hypothetical protein Pelo_19605 [Pelomyxa schiedti]|nr:hypothetical protein Pelo_19605 [Pelomyxa schiedti]
MGQTWSPSTIEAHAEATTETPSRFIQRLSAREQFLALAAGTLVARCGTNSSLRLLREFPGVLREFGQLWVVCASRVFGATVNLLGVGNVHVFVDVGLTAGVVRGACVLGEKGDVGIAGHLGNSRFVTLCVEEKGVGLYIVDWSGTRLRLLCKCRNGMPAVEGF